MIIFKYINAFKRGDLKLKNSLLLLIFGLFLIGCTNTEKNIKEENWKESATLIREVVVSQSGDKGDFVFRIGDNGKFGFGEYGPFIAGETQKYMWFFWGEKETLTKQFKVIGVSKDTGKRETVISSPAGDLLSPHLGADHHIPSSMMLPTSGLWKLEVYFGEELYGNVIVNVK